MLSAVWVSDPSIIRPQSELAPLGRRDQGSVYLLTQLVAARKSGKGRRLILVPEEIVQRLMEVPDRDGTSFNGFVSETLEQASEAYAGGLYLKRS